MDQAAVERLKSSHTVLYDPELVDNQAKLAAAIAEAKALIVRNRTQVRGELLDAAKNLACVGRLGVGLDNIDLAACKERGIAVYPATGANDLSVAEYVITAALVLLRGAWLSSDAVAAGEWPRQAMIGGEIAGKVMGLVGFGSIAREVAWRAQAFGMRIVAYDPYVEANDPAWQFARNVSLDGLLELSDVISLHVPLTETTMHLIDEKALSKTKAGAVLINAARGGVVDEDALAAALKAGKIGGAALDVFESEPLAKEAGARFSGIPNLVLTPHIAGVTKESNVRVSELIASRVLEHLEKSS